MLTNEMPIVSSNLSPGQCIYGGIYDTCDPFNAALPNNGALNPLGSVWTIPSMSVSGGSYGGANPLGLSSSGANTHTLNGYASTLTVKYVRYKSTGNPAMVAGPAPVYYTDNTFTTVSGVYSEGLGSGYTAAIAGWLLLNTATATTLGTGLGTLVSASIMNGNYVFIGVQGFIPLCYISDQGNITGTGIGIMGASGNFQCALLTTVNRVLGYTCSALSNTNYADVIATCGIY
jgi:hypothetical protein